MKIFVDGMSLTKKISGIGRATFELCKRLGNSKDLNELIIVSPGQVDEAFTEIKDILQVKPSSSVTWYSWRLAKLISLEKPDIFYSPSHRLPVYFSQDLPCVVTVHDLIWKKCPYSMRMLSRILEPQLFRNAVSKSDHIITVSESTASDLLDEYPELSNKVTTVYPGSAFANQSKMGAGKYALFVGTFEPRKNLPLLLDAYAQLPVSVKNELGLHIVGSYGWGGVDIFKEIRRRQLDNSVTVVLGPTSDALADEYQNCLFLVLPSKYEGFGLPIIEAMSFQKPSIVSNNSSLPEVVGNAGLIIDKPTAKSLSVVMQKVCQDSQLYDTVAANTLEQRRRFCWDSASRAYMDVFKTVLTQQNRFQVR